MTKNFPEISSLSADFVPAKIPGGPLLVVLHGLGDSAAGYRFLPQFLGFENINYLLLNAPDTYFTGYSWFNLDYAPGSGIRHSRELLFKTLDELREQGWPSERTGLFGFSQGALMSLDVALRYPYRLGPVVAISGFMYFLEEYPQALSEHARKLQILVTHGTMDPLLPLAATKAQITEIRKYGLNIRWREYAKEHTIAQEGEPDEIRGFLRENFR